MIKSLKEKYFSIPIPARASLWFVICGILQNGVSIITLPLFTRMLTTQQYGLSSSYFAWLDLIAVICTLRLNYGVFDKGMIKYEANRDYFESSLLGLSTSVSLIVLILFLVFHTFIEKWTGMSFMLCLSLFLIQILSPSILFWTAREKYELRYKGLTIFTLSSTFIVTFVNLLCVLITPFDRGVVKVVSFQILYGIVYFVFYIYIFLKGKKFFDKNIWTYALKFNIPLIPYFLSTLILDKADRIMIDMFCGKGEVALYSVSYNLARLMVILTAAIDAVFTPWIYQNIKMKKFKNNYKVVSEILVLFLMIAILFMLFAPELVGIFATEEYKSAVYIIPPVIASYFFVMIYNIVSKLEFYYEKTSVISLVTILAAVIDIGLNYWLIPRFGYIAAGYTTLASYIIMASIHCLVSRRIAKKEIKEHGVFPWVRIIFLSIFTTLITALVNILYINSVGRYVVMVLLLLLFIFFRNKIASILKTLKKDS